MSVMTLARTGLDVLPVSRLADFWTGENFDLNTIVGLPATFARNATAAPKDQTGLARTVNRECAAWESVDWDGDSVRETPGLLLGASDLIWWPFKGWPREMTIYLEFVENGTKSIASGALVYIGNAGNTGARLWIDSTGSFYRVRHHNGSTEVTSTLAAAPATGNRVAIRATMSAAGQVQIIQSINGAADTNGTLSGANTPAATWSDTRLYMGSTGSTNPGNTIFVRRRVAWGTRTAVQMIEAR